MEYTCISPQFGHELTTEVSQRLRIGDLHSNPRQFVLQEKTATALPMLDEYRPAPTARAAGL